MRKAVAIIQARWGSSRLPGKILKQLGETTVLNHVLTRCLAIEGIDEVCCAVPRSIDSDPVAEEARRCGVTVVRGSEADVLARYYQAATQTGADIVMRITSDCPLIDPAICAELLTQFESNNVDYASNNTPPTWPVGLDCEVMSFKWLKKAAVEASRPSEREHVTPYIRNHEQVRQCNLASPNSEIALHRWTLDTPDDYRFMTEIFSRLSSYSDPFSWNSTLDIVTQEPALVSINAGMDRRAGYKQSLVEDAAAGFDIIN